MVAEYLVPLSFKCFVLMLYRYFIRQTPKFFHGYAWNGTRLDPSSCFLYTSKITQTFILDPFLHEWWTNTLSIANFLLAFSLDTAPTSAIVHMPYHMARFDPYTTETQFCWREERKDGGEGRGQE